VSRFQKSRKDLLRSGCQGCDSWDQDPNWNNHEVVAEGAREAAFG